MIPTRTMSCPAVTLIAAYTKAGARGKLLSGGAQVAGQLVAQVLDQGRKVAGGGEEA